jgi:hypothetical protein
MDAAFPARAPHLQAHPKIDQQRQQRDQGGPAMLHHYVHSSESGTCAEKKVFVLF